MGDGVDIDWNVAIHVLDELSDGTHSFLELSYMMPHYNQEAFLGGLLFLVDRGLIELSKGVVNPEAIPEHEWPHRLDKAFGSAAPETELMSQTNIDLTGKGEEVLRLLNVGHPPISS